MLLLIIACTRPTFDNEASCQPDPPVAGAVRAKAIACSDEGLEGSAGGVGDWLIQSATATFVVRGTYAALTTLDEPGGTVVDASLRGVPDLLTEYRPDGDRSEIEAVNGDGWAELRLPGFTYRLEAGVDALEISSGSGWLVPGTFLQRVGGVVRWRRGGMIGLDGAIDEESAVVGGATGLTGVTRLALTPEALWPEGDDVAGEVDADDVLVTRDGVWVDRLPVVNGAYAGRVPAGAALTPEREGCTYDGMALVSCVNLSVRVADRDGKDLTAAVGDAAAHWVVPAGGGNVPVGALTAGRWVWAGPGYSAVEIAAGLDAMTAQLTRVVPDNVALVDLAREIAPDPDARWWSNEAIHDATGENIDMVVVFADDDVASLLVDEHDDVLAELGSRVGGDVEGWHFSGSSAKPAHGAVKHGFGAVDRLTLMRGGISTDRYTLVTAPWVAAARAESAPRDWPTVPDFLWLASLSELPVLTALLDDWIDVVPVGPRTWVDFRGAKNIQAIERGLLEGDVSAGNGPRVRLERVGEGYLRVTVDAPAWMGIDDVSVVTSAGQRAVHLSRGSAFVRVPSGTPWVVATVTGARAQPWASEAAWGVSGVVWGG